jgi:hypothetical protein
MHRLFLENSECRGYMPQTGMVRPFLVLAMSGEKIGWLFRCQYIRRGDDRNLLETYGQGSRTLFVEDEKIVLLSIIRRRKTFVGGGGSLFSLRRMLLEVIDLPEKIIFGGLQAHGCLVGDTEQLQGIFEEAAFYIFVLDAADLDLAVYPFETGRRVVIRKRGDGDLDGNELGFVVVVFVETSFQPAIGAILQVGAQQLVTVPVEEQDSHKQYGSNVFHVHKLITFLIKPGIFLQDPVY